MATADEIFVMTTEEPHIVINSDRSIKIPNSLKRLAVQHDHNIETVTFDCPRYWDDHDMSKMAIYINYMLSDGYTDSYPVDNVTVAGDIMHFTWTISRNVTHVSGVINFLVCVKNTDDEGNEVNHWNSELCQEAYVSKGMENEEIEALEQTDLITSLLLRMDSVEKINIKADEMQALLEETQAVAAAAEEVKNEALDASNYIKNSYANALKGNASGEVVRVDDVSPIEHTASVKVCGKNLIDVTQIPIGEESDTFNYVSSVGEGSITITSKENYNGNGYKYLGLTLRQLCPQIVAGRKYVLSAVSDAFNQRIYLQEAAQVWLFGEALIINDSMLDSKVVFYGYNPANNGYGDCIISNIQIEEGDTATEYEPYIDPSAATVSRCGKNLINWPSEQFIVYKTVDVCYPKGTYTLSADVTSDDTDASEALAEIKLSDASNIYVRLTRNMRNAKTFTANLPIARIALYAGFDYASSQGDTATWKNIQLEAGDVATDYEPYNGESYTPDQNGDVVITSVSPTMTLFTDTDGITIDLEYNRDTNKAFAELVEMINSK